MTRAVTGRFVDGILMGEKFIEGGTMKRLVTTATLAMAVLLMALPAFGQGGQIALSADPIFVDCDLSYDLPGSLVSIYVFHVYMLDGVSASSFRVDHASTGWIYLSDNPGFDIWTGFAPDGITISYGACIDTPTLIDVIQYFNVAGTPDCSSLVVGPHPASLSGQIEVCDCNGNLLVGVGSQLWIDLYGNCPCNVAKAIPALGPAKQGYCGPVPVKQSTWGEIKSLYRD